MVVNRRCGLCCVSGSGETVYRETVALATATSTAKTMPGNLGSANVEEPGSSTMLEESVDEPGLVDNPAPVPAVTKYVAVPQLRVLPLASGRHKTTLLSLRISILW
jgi:hypothetical protein